MKKLDVAKATGNDKLPAKIIKEYAVQLSIPVMRVVRQMEMRTRQSGPRGGDAASVSRKRHKNLEQEQEEEEEEEEALQVPPPPRRALPDMLPVIRAG